MFIESFASRYSRANTNGQKTSGPSLDLAKISPQLLASRPQRPDSIERTVPLEVSIVIVFDITICTVRVASPGSGAGPKDAALFNALPPHKFSVCSLIAKFAGKNRKSEPFTPKRLKITNQIASLLIGQPQISPKNQNFSDTLGLLCTAL